MENYREYLPELKSTTLFQDIEDEALITLLETMQPKIICKKAGDEPGPWNKEAFKVILRTKPASEIQPRRFKWDMPKFGEPGFLMGEIPELSRFMEKIDRPAGGKPPGPPSNLMEKDMDVMEMSGAMITKFYNTKVAETQGVMLRNLLGILAQKVMDVRQELFLLRDSRDIYNPQPPTESH